MRLKTALHLFFLLAACCVPFPYFLLGFQQDVAQFIFGPITHGVIALLWGVDLPNKEITSDSQALYILFSLLGILAFSLAPLWARVIFLRKQKNTFYAFSTLLLSYFLSLQLMRYGADKVFKAQFYLPEPNTLYTPIGQAGRDLLFWSSMGTSHSYNIFMGMLEIIAALFLLHLKTRLLGVIGACMVLANIVAINLGFDISVKAYSIFLWTLSLFLLSPYSKPVLLFLMGNAPPVMPPLMDNSIKNKKIIKTIRWIFPLVILAEAFSPYVLSGNLNDDNTPRPYLHGAYEVVRATCGNSPIPIDSLGMKRIFIHRKNYIIFQDFSDNFQDFSLKTNPNELSLSDYQLRQTTMPFTYSEKDSILRIDFHKRGKACTITAKALNWRDLPTIRKQFHWTVEGVGK